MKEFDIFKKVIVGSFDNLEQIKEEEENGKIIHPICRHINGICNDKIENLPKDFKGIFVIEESYYTKLGTDNTTVQPHLFLFEETKEGRVKLTSYEIPKTISRTEFTNNNPLLKLNYEELQVSSKFNPFVYTYTEGVGFKGGSLSNFSEDITFLLDETLSEDSFKVTEILKRGEEILVGFEEPIIYRREK